MSAQNIDSPFPELSDFGLTKHDIDYADTGFERFQTLHALAGVAAVIVGVAAAIVGYLITHPLGGKVVAPTAQTLAFVLYGLSAISLIIAAWEIPLSASEDRYWAKHREDRELIDFYAHWWRLRCEYFAQVEARELERQHLEHARKQREIADAAQAERARFAMEAIERDFEEARRERERRLLSSEPLQGSGGDNAKLFTGIDEEIKAIFFAMPQAERKKVLDVYEQEHGRSARVYAATSLPAWQSGHVNMSHKVAQRLIAIVPRFLDFNTRFELLKKLLERHRPQKLEWTVECTTENWKSVLLPLVDILSLASHVTFPPQLTDRLEWLIDADSTAVLKLIVAMETAEAEVGLSYLDDEFKRIDRMLRNMPGRATFTHRIDLPRGRITAIIAKPRANLLQLVKRLI